MVERRSINRKEMITEESLKFQKWKNIRLDKIGVNLLDNTFSHKFLKCT